MEQDSLLALWQDGVPLSIAWLVFADEWSQTRFRELQRTGSHVPLQQFLKNLLLDDLRGGKRRALGVKEGSESGPVLMGQYDFSKTAQVDWENDIVTAIGKVFHEARVEWQRELTEEGRPLKSTRWIHPRELETLQPLRPPTEVEGFVDPSEQWEHELLDETLVRDTEAPNTPEVQSEPQSPEGALPIEPAAERDDNAASKTPGRPSKVLEIERAIEILLESGVDLANMPRLKAYKVVKGCAEKELKSNTKRGFSDPVIHRALFRRFGQLR